MMTGIVSLQDLAWTIGVPLERLRDIAASIDDHYRVKVLRKGAKVRHLYVPRPELMSILRLLNRRVLGGLPISAAAHGGVSGRSVRTNAEAHLGQPCLVTVDVRQFFPNVRPDVVNHMLRKEFGFGREVAYLITKLTTYRAELPQGAPTSTTIANMLLTKPLDEPLGEAAQRVDSRYTRFIDDAAASGSNPRPLINDIASRLSARGLRVHRPKRGEPNKSKLKIMPGHVPQRITGLNVNSKSGPSVPREVRDAVRASIHALKFLPQDQHAAQVASIRGKIAYIAQFNSGVAKRLRSMLHAITSATEQASEP